MKKTAIACGLLSAIMLIGLTCLLGAYPGNVGTIGTNSVTQTSPLAVSGTLSKPAPGYAIQGSGAFTLAGTNTVAFYLSSGTTTATSTPCNSVTLSLAGTGMVTSGGTTGMGFSTSGTSSWSAPLTLSITNLNTLAVTGTGQVGYLYSQ
jgi:hypothetical protein